MGTVIARPAHTTALPSAFLAAISLSLSLLWLAVSTSQERLVVLPVAIMINTVIGMVALLWWRDGVLPVFELGVVCVVVTGIYCIVPPLGYLLAGMQWTPFSDNRIFTRQPNPAQVGEFIWRHVVYLGVLAAAYAAVRGRTFVGTARLRAEAPGVLPAVVILIAVFAVYFALLFEYTGVSYRVTHEQQAAGALLPTDLPLFIGQISHNLSRIGLFLKMWLIALLLMRWQSRGARWLLFGWLGLEGARMVIAMGSRTEFTILILVTILLYHRLVNTLTFRRAFATLALSVSALLLYGFMRDYGRYVDDFALLGVPLQSSANEFQILWGTSYDLMARKLANGIGEVPWAIYFSDLFLLFPAQMLPFEKLDPSWWYLGLINASGSGFGGMFGVISQSVIGFGFVELVLRGIVLGGGFALIHRWYVKRQESFWVTALYLALCIWSYYTYRASTFYIVYFVVYSFLPAMILVRLSAELMRGARPVPEPESYSQIMPAPGTA
jgi:hypothetical protein